MSRTEDADSRFASDLEQAMALSIETAALEKAAREKRQHRDFAVPSRPLASPSRLWGPRRASTPENMAQHRHESSSSVRRLGSNHSALAFPSLDENSRSTSDTAKPRPRPMVKGANRNASNMLLPSPSRRQSAPHDVRSSTPINDGSAHSRAGLSSPSTWGEDCKLEQQAQDSKNNNNLIDWTGGLSDFRNNLPRLYASNQKPSLEGPPVPNPRTDSLSRVSSIYPNLAIQYSGPESMPLGGNFNQGNYLPATLQLGNVQGGLTKSMSWSEGNPLSLQTARQRLMMRESCSDFVLKNKQSDCLIDLGQAPMSSQLREQEKRMTRVSVVDFFDPLSGGGTEVELTEETFRQDEMDSHDPSGNGNTSYFSAGESSFFDSADPFEYMSNRSENSSSGRVRNQDPFEECDIGISDSKHNLSESIHESSRPPTKVNPSIEILPGLHKEKNVTTDKEIVAFVQMVRDVRSRFKFDATKTNPGIVMCPKITGVYPEDTCIKIVVHWSSGETRKLTTFTSDVTNKVEMLIGKAAVDFMDSTDMDTSDFFFQVMGSIEVLDPNACLKDFEYVHQCYKFDRDVEFELTHRKNLVLPYLRTAQDDLRASTIRMEDISPKDQTKTLSYDDLHLVLENLTREIENMKRGVELLKSQTENRSIECPCLQKVTQSVKLVCAKLGFIETLEVSKAMDAFLERCMEFDQYHDGYAFFRQSARHFVNDEGSNEIVNYAHYDHDEPVDKKAERIFQALDKLTHTVQQSLVTYSKSFRVNFSFNNEEDLVSQSPILSDIVKDTFFFHVDAVHRLDSSWFYDDYGLRVDLYHGTTCIIKPLFCKITGMTESFYTRIKFDNTIDLEKPISMIPREARLVFTLTGRRIVQKGEDRKIVKKELGWASLQLFSFNRHLVSGSYFLTLWSKDAEKQIGPAPDSGSHPNADTCPLLSIRIPEWERSVIFPDKIPLDITHINERNQFGELPVKVQQELMDICELDIMTFKELSKSVQEAFWEKRYYLKNIPGALPKVLLSAGSWDLETLPELYAMLQTWEKPQPMDILQLFLPIFPDDQVRRCAIEWMAEMNNDDIVDYLPQLLEALKHETWSNSPLASLLLERSLSSPRIAHYLYWYLTQSLPGNMPQNTSEDRICEVRVARYRRRLQMLMRALLIIVGEAMENSFHKQTRLLLLMNDAAKEVKNTKDSNRIAVLRSHMAAVNTHLQSTQTALPLSPGRIACGVDVSRCSYFKSNTVPLKIMFQTRDNFGLDENQMSPEGSPGFDQKGFPTLESSSIAPVIFKRGDDLRQDSLTIQLIRVMEKIWLGEGLDLKMVTFSCVPTGDCEGMVELVRQAKTLREIQTAHGMKVGLRVQSIQEWLQKTNQSPLEYSRAIENFTKSCAGYCIATYILGVCDRHNDNIMIKTTGHLFHIDFGKLLGDAQMFINFKRDRTPFVLTQDMAYVINGGEKPSQKFQDFVDLCCKGFNILRKNGNMLLNLLTLMSSSGIRGINPNAVRFVQKALLPDLSNSEASQHFSRMIEESLNHWFTQWNFLFHNLGQKNSDKSDASLLSFADRRSSRIVDGVITNVQVVNVQKRYKPDKHYMFILKIKREGVRDESHLFRSYKEFCELESKIASAYPGHDCPSLGRSAFTIGRQEIMEVAQHRKMAISHFLMGLFQDPILSQCDLVYTFFQPILRDQEEVNIQQKKLKGMNRNESASKQIQGELQLSLEYRKETLFVMVRHGKNLPKVPGSNEEPNSYVKTYLKPDPRKETKRKTKVVKKKCHPSYMEILEYRIQFLDKIRCQTLEVTVWNDDLFQENQFLGCVNIPLENLDLNRETTRWYKLQNFSRPF